MLEDAHETQLTRRVVTIQKTFRGYIVRKRYKKLRKACITLQKCWRSRAAVRRYRKVSYVDSHSIRLMDTDKHTAF